MYVCVLCVVCREEEEEEEEEEGVGVERGEEGKCRRKKRMK